MLSKVHHARLAEPLLREALHDTPVALVHGPRQCGKTTLARAVGEPLGFASFTFDDPATLDAATSDPVGFIDSLPEQTILDEVQRVPELFVTIKASVDRHRVPGRFILTGSANVLLLPRLSDSLAGRMALIRLRPLARCELEGTRGVFLDRLFGGDLESAQGERLGDELAERIVAGGYPEALARKTPARRRAWYADYLDAVVQRDVRDVARIRSLDALPRLLELAASQTARLINISDLAGPFAMSRPTITQYVSLLEILFLVEQLPAWHGNRLKRLVRSPKLHVCDTGLACALLRIDAPALRADRGLMGQLLETFVVQELRRQASGDCLWDRFQHYRDKDKLEVDLVIERGAGNLVGVEVKAAATVQSKDFAGLRRLRQIAGDRFQRGVLLHDGTASWQQDDRLYAVPIRELWA